MLTLHACQNSGGAHETHGLSLLDVVKHAVTTIIEVLQVRGTPLGDHTRGGVPAALRPPSLAPGGH